MACTSSKSYYLLQAEATAESPEKGNLPAKGTQKSRNNSLLCYQSYWAAVLMN